MVVKIPKAREYERVTLNEGGLFSTYRYKDEYVGHYTAYLNPNKIVGLAEIKANQTKIVFEKGIEDILVDLPIEEVTDLINMEGF